MPGGSNGLPAKYEQVVIESPQLFDLQNDLSESTDVADKNPDVVRHLLEVAERARIDLGDSLTKLAREGSPSGGEAG